MTCLIVSENDFFFGSAEARTQEQITQSPTKRENMVGRRITVKISDTVVRGA
jgi:hypothetical protein